MSRKRKQNKTWHVLFSNVQAVCLGTNFTIINHQKLSGVQNEIIFHCIKPPIQPKNINKKWRKNVKSDISKYNQRSSKVWRVKRLRQNRRRNWKETIFHLTSLIYTSMAAFCGKLKKRSHTQLCVSLGKYEEDLKLFEIPGHSWRSN